MKSKTKSEKSMGVKVSKFEEKRWIKRRRRRKRKKTIIAPNLLRPPCEKWRSEFA